TLSPTVGYTWHASSLALSVWLCWHGRIAVVDRSLFFIFESFFNERKVSFFPNNLAAMFLIFLFWCVLVSGFGFRVLILNSLPICVETDLPGSQANELTFSFY